MGERAHIWFSRDHESRHTPNTHFDTYRSVDGGKTEKIDHTDNREHHVEITREHDDGTTSQH